MGKEENKSKWYGIINEQMASHQTQAQWCAENSVNIHSFRYWKKRFNQTTNQKQQVGIGFVSLKPAMQQEQSVMVHIGGARLEICESSSLALIDDVIRVLMRYA